MKYTHAKIICGPGGIKCNCCRSGSVKQSRVALNRRNRRSAKLKIANE